MPRLDGDVVKINEIVVLWEWPDSTCCVLCEGNSGELELRVLRDRQTIRCEPAVDVLVAVYRTAPALEIELLSARGDLTT